MARSSGDGGVVATIMIMVVVGIANKTARKKNVGIVSATRLTRIHLRHFGDFVTFLMEFRTGIPERLRFVTIGVCRYNANGANMMAVVDEKK